MVGMLEFLVVLWGFLVDRGPKGLAVQNICAR